MTGLERLKQGIASFMRGCYRLDEVAGMYYEVPCLRFRQGKKTLVTFLLHQDHVSAQIVLGQAERTRTETILQELPDEIQELYTRAATYHDGKWLMIPLEDEARWEAVKRLILIKKKPNRKPFSQKNALYGRCGHRCDLCVHYTGISEEFRQSLLPHLNAVYGELDWSMRCTGCATDGCHCCAEGGEECPTLKCLRKQTLHSCFACADYPCEQATVGYRLLEHKNLSADDVTWAVLPYVPGQYEIQVSE